MSYQPKTGAEPKHRVRDYIAAAVLLIGLLLIGAVLATAPLLAMIVALFKS